MNHHRFARTGWLSPVVVVALAALTVLIIGGGALPDAPVRAQDDTNNPAPGTITFALPDGTLHRLAAQPGATPENVSAALDALLAGDTAANGTDDDEWLNTAPGGDWLLTSTDRVDADCAGWPCLLLLPADLSAYEVVRAAGAVVHSEGFSAVASGGNLIVFPAQDGPHALDLWVITRDADGGWSAPRPITADSPYAYHKQPALSGDGTRVVFDCGPEPYADAGNAICTVNTDGSAFRVVWTPDQPPTGAGAGTALHHPDFTPDGDVVFEADWNDSEAIWRLDLDAAGAPIGEPVLLSGAATNDNSPCVLPDGRVVSLWLNRDGGPGYHEIKLMPGTGQPADAAPTLLLMDQDVFDVGIGCGGGMLDSGMGESAMGQGNADVTFVRAVQASDGTWAFHVTVMHPDTGWEDYADGWDVVLPDGTVVKANPDDPFTRLLLHPHENEQPFTRSQRGLTIPDGVTQVTVRAHDLVDGWGGQTVTVDLTADSGPGFEVERDG